MSGRDTPLNWLLVILFSWKNKNMIVLVSFTCELLLRRSILHIQLSFFVNHLGLFLATALSNFCICSSRFVVSYCSVSVIRCIYNIYLLK